MLGGTIYYAGMGPIYPLGYDSPTAVHELPWHSLLSVSVEGSLDKEEIHKLFELQCSSMRADVNTLNRVQRRDRMLQERRSADMDKPT